LTGISSSSLQLYESNESQEIGSENLKTLAKFYGVTCDYLLELTETTQPDRADLSQLHLTDQTIEILKSSHFNHQLLCELIQHEGFEKFLADIEIYVDGIAASQLHTLNTYVTFTRNQIIEQYHPGEDFTMQELNACRVDEYQFFLQTIQSDLGEMIKDLRKTHAGEKETAPDETLVESLMQEMKSYEKVKGKDLDMQFAHLCKLLKINVSKVPELEKIFVTLFLKRSKNFRALKGLFGSK